MVELKYFLVNGLDSSNNIWVLLFKDLLSCINQYKQLTKHLCYKNSAEVTKRFNNFSNPGNDIKENIFIFDSWKKYDQTYLTRIV